MWLVKIMNLGQKYLKLGNRWVNSWIWPKILEIFSLRCCKLYFFKCKFRLWHLQPVHTVSNEQIRSLGWLTDVWVLKAEVLLWGGLERLLKCGYVILCALESVLYATNKNKGLNLGLAKCHILSRFYNTYKVWFLN